MGGQGLRMGGAAKGLLQTPASGGRIVDRLVAMISALGLECCLVGTHPAYASLSLPGLADAPPGIGPLGGLRALLAAARGRDVIAIACDLPFVDASVVRRLAAVHPNDAIAPRVDERWQPLCARYGPSVLSHVDAAIAVDRRSLQALLDRVDAEVLDLSIDESLSLRDWDTREDVARDISATKPRAR